MAMIDDIEKEVINEWLITQRIRFDKPLPKPPAVISIDEDPNNIIPIFTRGNISVITGKAKSKKSFFTSSFPVAFLESECSIANINGYGKNGEVAVYFDTEMEGYYSQRLGFSVHKQLSPKNKERYHHYDLRVLSNSDKITMIENTLRLLPQIGIVIIDGIKDLSTKGINDEEEAIEIVSRLMRWSTVYNVHICCILHQNKADKQVGGHLGSEVVKKAETVISVEKAVDETFISNVKAEFTRGREFSPFAFYLDDDLFPVRTDYSKPVNRQKIVTIQNTLNECFVKGNELYTYTELVEIYKEKTNVSLRTAKQHISDAVNMEIISKNRSSMYELSKT